MPRAICPDCGELVRIEPTGRKVREGFTAEWQRISMHFSDTTMAGTIVVHTKCEGSGKNV